jgi:hypothetical protein
MLTLRLSCLFVGVLSCALGFGQTTPRIEDLVRHARVFEENTRLLTFKFEGERVYHQPPEQPGLKTQPGSIKLERHVLHVIGNFEKAGRAFRTTYQPGWSANPWVAVSDGYRIAEFEEDSKRDLGGVSGSMNHAKFKSRIPLMEFFGVLQTGDADAGDIDWFTKPLLSAEIEQAEILSVMRLEGGIAKIVLGGLAEDLHLELNIDREGEIRSFGYHLDRNGARLIKRWSMEEYQDLGGKYVPTHLAYAYEYGDQFQVWERDSWKWSLTDVATTADKDRILAPLPDGMVFTTYDGKKAGRVAIDGGKVKEVDPDYGTEAYHRRILLRRAAYALGPAFLVGLGVVVVRRRRLSIRA